MDMPGTYRVVFTRVIRQEMAVEVEAADRYDAIEKAKLQMVSGEAEKTHHWKDMELGQAKQSGVGRVA